MFYLTTHSTHFIYGYMTSEWVNKDQSRYCCNWREIQPAVSVRGTCEKSDILDCEDLTVHVKRWSVDDGLSEFEPEVRHTGMSFYRLCLP